MLLLHNFFNYFSYENIFLLNLCGFCLEGDILFLCIVSIYVTSTLWMLSLPLLWVKMHVFV